MCVALLFARRRNCTDYQLSGYEIDNASEISCLSSLVHCAWTNLINASKNNETIPVKPE